MTLPKTPGETTSIATADATLVIKMNSDGTYDISIDGTVLYASVTEEFAIQFIAGMQADYGDEIDPSDDSPSP